MRVPLSALSFFLMVIGIAKEAGAQAAVASDLWRVAQGTLVQPAALSDDGGAAFWTPALALGSGERLRIGVEAIHAPSEIGVNGGLMALAVRAGGLGTVNLTYGRLGLGGVGYTETSPELIGTLGIYNQTMSVGFARRLSRVVTGGFAVRYLTGRLALAARSQFGLDLGVQYATPSLRLGVSTRFFDPAFGTSREATTYSAGAEYRTPAIAGWGTRASLALRYGVSAAPGDGVQHLVSAGLNIGGSLTLDLGAVREQTSTEGLWRSLLGIGIGTGRYVVRIGRDGGVNGFGATYRFGLTAVFK